MILRMIKQFSVLVEPYVVIKSKAFQNLVLMLKIVPLGPYIIHDSYSIWLIIQLYSELIMSFSHCCSYHMFQVQFQRKIWRLTNVSSKKNSTKLQTAFFHMYNHGVACSAWCLERSQEICHDLWDLSVGSRDYFLSQNKNIKKC